MQPWNFCVSDRYSHFFANWLQFMFFWFLKLSSIFCVRDSQYFLKLSSKVFTRDLRDSAPGGSTCRRWTWASCGPRAPRWPAERPWPRRARSRSCRTPRLSCSCLLDGTPRNGSLLRLSGKWSVCYIYINLSNYQLKGRTLCVYNNNIALYSDPAITFHKLNTKLKLSLF